MKRCSENRGVSLRTVIFHIQTSTITYLNLPLELEWEEILSRCLLMIPPTSSPSAKKHPILKEINIQSFFTRLFIAQSILTHRNTTIFLSYSYNKSKTNSKALPFCKTPQPPDPFPSVKQYLGQQKIIMGISMSQSEEIRRLKLHDLQYREKSLVRFHSSSPAQFRDIENQQVDNKAKHKQVITEPSFKMKQQQPHSRINQTLNYELDMDLQEVTPRTKTKGKGTERLRESNPVKENSYSEVLRVSKAQEYPNNEASPSVMRARKVKIGKK